MKRLETFLANEVYSTNVPKGTILQKLMRKQSTTNFNYAINLVNQSNNTLKDAVGATSQVTIPLGGNDVSQFNRLKKSGHVSHPTLLRSTTMLNAHSVLGLNEHYSLKPL